MKKIISMVVMFVASALSIVSCANNNTTATNETSKNKENNMSTSISGKKTLVVFFSIRAKTMVSATYRKATPISSQK